MRFALAASLAALLVFAAAMLIGWSQPASNDAPRAALERHMSGGADLRANNPFAGDKK